jgi:hypothetical protein
MKGSATCVPDHGKVKALTLVIWVIDASLSAHNFSAGLMLK